jgi:hypothetical protein
MVQLVASMTVRNGFGVLLGFVTITVPGIVGELIGAPHTPSGDIGHDLVREQINDSDDAVPITIIELVAVRKDDNAVGSRIGGCDCAVHGGGEKDGNDCSLCIT